MTSGFGSSRKKLEHGSVFVDELVERAEVAGDDGWIEKRLGVSKGGGVPKMSIRRVAAASHADRMGRRRKS